MTRLTSQSVTPRRTSLVSVHLDHLVGSLDLAVLIASRPQGYDDCLNLFLSDLLDCFSSFGGSLFMV